MATEVGPGEVRERGSEVTVRVHRNGMGVPDLDDFAERFDDEDEGDEDGETLFSESGDVANETAQVESHDDQQVDEGPESDAAAEGEEVYRVFSAEVIFILLMTIRHALQSVSIGAWRGSSQQKFPIGA